MSTEVAEEVPLLAVAPAATREASPAVPWASGGLSAAVTCLLIASKMILCQTVTSCFNICISFTPHAMPFINMQYDMKFMSHINL